MPSQLHDSAGRHHDALDLHHLARLLLQTRLTCRLMQHNWSCMFVFPHLSLCFLHTSVRFLPPIRAGHHPASLAIGRLVGMRLHFLILLRLSSCCGEKGSSICASFVLFSAHVVTFFCNPNAWYTVSRLKSCARDRLKLRINSFKVETRNLYCRLAVVPLHILCLIALMAWCFLSFPFLISVLPEINYFPYFGSEGVIILY